MSEWAETHLPCPCGTSSDAYSVNTNGWGTCFTCEKKFPPDGVQASETGDPVSPMNPDLLPMGDIRGLASRKINLQTCERFGYAHGEHYGQSCHIAPYYDENKRLIGQKIRMSGKKFSVVGTLDDQLFGRKLWGSSGKRLVITEGEIDAMAYAQATNLSWPVVSIPAGAAAAIKAVKKNLEFIESFEEVVFLFDNDDPGISAANKCADLIIPGKAKIASLPLKDPGEMLKAGRIKELVSAVWNAESKRPDGIVNGSELWEDISKPIEMGLAYPFAGLNRLLFGQRPSEIVTLCAGTGIGKSTIAREIAYHNAMVHKVNVGYVALEEGNARSGLGFMGMYVNKPIHLPGYALDIKEKQVAFAATLGTKRFTFYDHFGSLDSDNLLNKLRYLVIGLGCRYLVLDHLSIVVSGMDLDGDERRMIDYTMTALRSFVENTKASLTIVSHLKRPPGLGHEDGGLTSLSQLRGSAAIGQLSDAVVGLERNQQDDDSLAKNTVVARVLKNRYAGITGVACNLFYDHETGRLTEDTDFDADSADTRAPDF